MDRTGNTVIEALVRSLEAAAKFNPNDVVHPYAVLWMDHDGQWQPIIAQLRRLLPQLLTFGDYEREHRSGPAIWLRSVVDRALPDVELPEWCNTHRLSARRQPAGAGRGPGMPGQP